MILMDWTASSVLCQGSLLHRNDEDTALYLYDKQTSETGQLSNINHIFISDRLW